MIEKNTCLVCSVERVEAWITDHCTAPVNSNYTKESEHNTLGEM